MSVVDSLHKIAIEKVNEIKKANSFIKEDNGVTLNTEKKQEFDPMWKIAHDEAVDEYNKVKALLVSYKSA